MKSLEKKVESISKVLRRREKVEEKREEMTDVQLTRQNVRKKIRKLRERSSCMARRNRHPRLPRARETGD